MKTIEEKIDLELKRHGLIRDMLTTEELEQLREEIIAEGNGAQFLDGVLFGIPIYTRIYDYYRSRGLEVPPPSEDDYDADEDEDYE